MARIYVASSWRCKWQPETVTALRRAGHEVYDFRHPEPGDRGFGWSEIDPKWLAWDPATFRACLEHPRAIEGFNKDMSALRWCDACVCVLPCNRSAHLELGWACGAGKRTSIFIPEPQEPELMYRALGAIVIDVRELIEWADGVAL